MSTELEQVGPGVWQVAPSGGMRVPARLYASEKLLAAIRSDRSLLQACNVAHLPGIIGASLAMPDMHEGYGFPIGGVAAFDAEDGVVSPGGVGYDINCGVRLMRTDLLAAELGESTAKLVHQIQRDVPAGVGSEGAIATLAERDLDEVLRDGAAWAVRHGYGEPDDLEYTEAAGCLAGADPRALSHRARERGAPQLGTLGSGNHFAEIRSWTRCSMRRPPQRLVSLRAWSPCSSTRVRADSGTRCATTPSPLCTRGRAATGSPSPTRSW